MTTYRLTLKQRREWRPILAEFFSGYKCFYCKVDFNEEYKGFGETFDHLNDKEWDNRIENVVLCHSMCNQKKKWSEDYQIMAKHQIQMNEKDGVLQKMGERKKKSRQLTNEREEERTTKDNEEIYSHTEFVKITSEDLAEKLSIEDRVPFKSTIDAIAMKCNKQVGHGSPNTIRRIMDMLCSTEGLYMVERDGGKRWIKKRDQGLLTT